MPHEEYSETQAVQDLQSDTCKCGQKKRKYQSFCSVCYFHLPAQMRQNLYYGVGSGYEEAFTAAAEWLAANKNRAPV
jgi:hypothetical protein